MSDNRVELFFVAEDAGAKWTKGFKSLVDPLVNVSSISKVAGDDGAEITEFVIEGYEACTVAY